MLTPIQNNPQKPVISENLSVSLDVARAAAAIYVAIHHIATSRGWAANGIGLLFRFGQEAVIIFFLLSGFVIFANEYHRISNPFGYFYRRIRRIYPPLLGAIIVSSLVAIDNGEFIEKFNIFSLLSTIANIQDISFLKPGVISDPYMGNEPLWSLSYEVLFYLIFPICAKLHKKKSTFTNNIVGIACALSYFIYIFYPNHWCLVFAYFQMWWCGAMIAHAYLAGGRDFRSIKAPLFWLLALTAVSAAGLGIKGFHGIGYFPFLMTRHFGFAALLIVLLYSGIGRSLSSLLGKTGRMAGVIASISYGIYVLHYPLLVSWKRSTTIQGLLFSILLLLPLAYFFDRMLSRWLPRAR